MNRILKTSKGNQKYSEMVWQWNKDNLKPMECNKAVLWGQFIAIKYYPEIIKTLNRQLNLHLEQLEKEEEIKLAAGRKS